MILLDTPVLIDALSPTPDPNLIDFLNSHPIEKFFISTSSLSALIAALPMNSDAIDSMYSRIVSTFESRIAPFDLAATKKLHSLIRTLSERNISVPMLTLQNVSIAASLDYQLVSLNTEPLIDMGVELIDLGATNLTESA